MGYDIFFTSVAESAQTVKMNISYSFNAFYRYFDMPRYRGKTAVEMIAPLEAGIAELKRVFHNLEITKDPLKATPGNYHQFLTYILHTAKMHPTWIFHCD